MKFLLLSLYHNIGAVLVGTGMQKTSVFPEKVANLTFFKWCTRQVIQIPNLLQLEEREKKKCISLRKGFQDLEDSSRNYKQAKKW